MHILWIEGPGVSREKHELVELVLPCVDAVYHEVLVETCPFDIMSETTKRDVRKKIYVDVFIPSRYKFRYIFALPDTCFNYNVFL